MFIIITILIGIIGGSIAIRLRMPAGAVVGSLIAVALYSVFTGKAEYPQSFTFMTQIGTGAYIGSRIRNKDVVELRRIIKPAIVLTVSMCSFGIFAGTLISIYTDIDLTTALFATAPAGLTDMTLASVDFGADSSRVASFQFVRLISMIAVMPNLIKYFLLKTNRVAVEDRTGQELKRSKTNTNEAFKRIIYTSVVGFTFGFIGYVSGFPAGAISFSMIACAAYNIRTSKAYIPVKLRRFIQFLGGALIGSRITMGQVIGIKELLPIMAIVVTGYIGLTFALGFLMTKFSTLDLTTALYSSTAGGLTDMAIIACEMGADAPKVAALQFVRVMTIIAFYPIIIKLILSAIN